MELLYVWVESYGNIKRQGFNFSPNYDFEVKEQENGEYTLADNYEEAKKKGEFKEQPKNFFGEKISNITAIVGKNGSGKSTLLDTFNSEPLLIQESIVIFKSENDYYFSTGTISKDASLIIKFKKIRLKSLHSLEVLSFVYYENSYNSQYKSKALSYSNQDVKDIGLNQIIYDYRNKIKNKEIMEQLIFSQSRGFSGLWNEISEFNIPSLLLVSNQIEKDIIEDKINEKIARFEKKVYELIKQFKSGVFDDLFEYNQSDYQSMFLLKFSFNMLKILNTRGKSNDKALEIENCLEIIFKDFFNALKNFELEYKGVKVEKKPKKGIGLIVMNSEYVTNRNKVIEKMIDFENWNRELYEYLNSQDKEFVEIYKQNYDFFFEYGNDIKFTSNGALIKIKNIKEQLLKLLGINREVEMKYNCFGYDWLTLSSGEKALLGVLSRIFFIKDEVETKDVIFLMDEPECSLHPEWQRLFMKVFIEFTKEAFKDKSIQIILTSHSPFVASDLPRENVIMLNTYDEKDNEVINGEQRVGNCKIMKDKEIKTFGANIFDLYSNAFFVKSSFGEFAKGKIKEVVRWLEYTEDKNTKERTYTNEREINKEQIEYLLNSIGEPLVKNKLQKMYDEYRKCKIKKITEDDKNKKIQEMIKNSEFEEEDFKAYLEKKND